MAEKTICDLPDLIGGPFKQVMYLGCSVKDFKISAGWGGETSSCTVTLVQDKEDLSANWEKPEFDKPPQELYQNEDSIVFKEDHLEYPQNDPDQELNSDIQNFPNIKKKYEEGWNGKICYNVYNPYSNQDFIELKKPDPGFLADDAAKRKGGFVNPDQIIKPGTLWKDKYDIIGVPTIFKWEDIFFGGIIQNWTKKDDGSYSVEINSFSKILKGMTLILKEYYGSIETNVNGYSVPFNWAFFPSTDYITPWPERADERNWGYGSYTNIFNIYGYLESQGFGYSGYGRDKGIPASKVYDAVKEIFTPTTDEDIIFKVNSPFTPHPGAATRQLFHKKDYTKLTASDIEYEGVNLNNFGLLDGNLFGVDFTNVPKPPEGVYINSDTMDLISFIDFCCEGAGMDYYIYFDGVVRIQTIDRKEFKYRNDLFRYVNELVSSDKVISYNIGEEYAHNQGRKIVIGGNQKRLLQCNSFSINTPYYKVYDPNTNQFFSNAGSQENFRQPNWLNWMGTSSAVAGGLDEEKFISSLGYSWSPHNFNDVISAVGRLQSTIKGSYFDYVDPGSSSYLGANNISPFFGIGKNGKFRDTYWDTKTGQMLLKLNWTDIEPFMPGLYDNTYSASVLQSWVRTNIQGQDGFIDYSPLEYGAGDFLITEYELRAAGAGFDQWWHYNQTRAQFGAPSDLARIIYNYLAKNYSLPFAIAILFTDTAYDKPRFDYMAYTQVASATYSGRPLNLKPVSYEQYVAWASGFRNTLKSIHAFISDLVNTHYGKTYAVRLPNVLRGYDADGGKDNYEITDAAWESKGNMIDDTMFVGSAVLTKLQQDDGRIGPLLGFDNQAQFVPYGGPATDMPQESFAPSHYSMTYMMALKMGFIGGTRYWPLVHNFANDSSVMIPYGTYSYYNAHLPSRVAIDDPDTLFADEASQAFKLYTKASPLTLNSQDKLNPNIIYDGFFPKIILTPPGEISSIADTSMNGIYDEIWALHKQGINRPSTTDTIADRAFDSLPSSVTIPYSLQIFLKFMMWQKSRQGILDDLVDDNPALINKAPLPTFAAIPIESKYYRYGPWVNNAYDLRDKIAKDLTEEEQNGIINNLYGSTEAVIEDTLVPWEFGDEWTMNGAASSLASLGNQYQTNIEVGTITFAGLVIRGVNAGDKLVNDKASAIISSITFSMDPSNGLTSTYQFRTTSKKIGLFNKELSDTYKSFSQQGYRNNLKMVRQNTRTVSAAGIASTTPNSTLYSRFRSAQLSAFGMNPATQVAARSPITNSNMPANFVMVANNFVSPDRYSFQGSYKSPNNVNVVSDNGGPSRSYISIIPDTEAFKLCGPNYDKVSMMSFDGLFSPISLYPTLNNSTFHLAKYTREQCPYCRGNTQEYVHHYVDMTSLSEKEPEDIKTTDTDNTKIKKTKVYQRSNCPFCIPRSEKNQQIKGYHKKNLIDPPYILVSGSDDYAENRMEEYRDNPLYINKYTLNPIIMNSGDFGIDSARQKGDKSCHNIDIAGFGHLPPDAGTSARGSLSADTSYNTQALDLALKAKNQSPQDLQNNVRFIGLRGPLMVHGWGYDVNGYPVPNASGQYKTILGQQQFHNGKPLFKNQIVKSDGTVTDPYPEHTFAKGWADQPGSWPVGPVDLRWDSNSCTWVSPQGYKRVWVTIEHDLFGEQPVRGHINSMGEPTDILPSGFRRVVYVSNPLGTTKAPRQSALYCEYSPENNHYLPLNVGAFFATGTIDSAGTATIYANYAYIEEDADPLSYSASFENPLGFTISNGIPGIFVFGGENGWILQSIKGG